MKLGFIPTEGGHFYREALEEVVLAEELGFDSVWMEEHHGIKDHYWPSPLMVLAGLKGYLALLVGVWAYYHVMRQHYGFMVLYKVKNRDLLPIDNTLDRAFLGMMRRCPTFATSNRTHGADCWRFPRQYELPC